MGIFDGLKNRLRGQSGTESVEAPKPTAALKALPAAKAPPQGEQGLSGTAILGGRIYAEANPKLKGELAYGRPASEEWGEWEKLERTDHAVSTALDFISAPLRDASPEVEPGDDSELGLKIASFVKDNLVEWLEPRWPTLNEQIVKGGLGYGFSLHERVWGWRDDDRVPGGRAVYLRKLAQRLPSSLAYDAWVVKDGELSAVKQMGLKDGLWVQNVELPADKILLATWNRAGQNFQGYSAFRPVWYLATLRSELLRILAIGHSRESLGVPTAYADKDTKLSQKQLDAIQAMLEGLVFHENAAYSLPPGVRIEWFFSPGANKGHVLETWKAFGLAILETVHAQQLFLGTNGTGSRSVGEVHDDSKNLYVEGVRAWIEGVFNGVGEQPYTGIVRQLVDFNFGPQKRYPVLKLVTKKASIPVGELSTAVKTLSDAGGLMLTEDDEAHFRQTLGMPAIDPEKRAELVAQKEAAKAAMAEAMKAGADKGESDESDDDEAAPPKRGPPNLKALSDSADVFTPSRPLRPTEQHLDLTEMNAFHTRGRLDFERDVKAICREMLRGALPAVREAMKDGDPSELSGLALDGRLLGKHVESFVERARLYGYRTAELERRRQPADLLAKRAAGSPGIKPIAFADRMSRVLALASAEEEDDKAPISEPDTAGAEYAPAPVEKLVKAQTQLVTNRIKNRLKQQVQDYAIDVARAGGSAERVIEGVLDDVEESKTLRTDAGLVIARSFSMGREEFFEAHGDDLAGMEYSAILDPSTCVECASLDGREVEFGSAEHDAITPPYAQCRGGANCRCLLVAVWKSGGGFQKVEE